MKKQLLLSIAILFVAKISAQSIQFVHNTDDDSLAQVKLWINDTVWVNNFSFPSATPVWTNVATGIYTIGISNLSDTSQAQSIIQKTINVQAAEEHFVTLNGVTKIAQYPPSSTITPLVIADYTVGFTTAPNATQTAVQFYNGSTVSGNIMIQGQGGDNPIMGYTQTWQGILSASQKTIGVSGDGGLYGFYGGYLLPLQNYTGQNIHVVINGYTNGIIGKVNKTYIDYKVKLFIVEPSGTMTKLSEAHIPIGIKENPSNKINLSVYPNPASEILNVDISTSLNVTENLFVSIIDIYGREVIGNKQLTIKSGITEIDVKNLSKGMYVLRLSNQNKEVLYQQKLVKE